MKNPLHIGLLVLLAFMAGRYYPVPPQQVDVMKEEVNRLELSELIRGSNPEDGMLWGALVNKAKVCENCPALREWENGSSYLVRPMTVHFHEPGTSVAYIMVLGKVGHHVGGTKMVMPVITYYIGTQGGGLIRLENGKGEYQTGTNDWHPLRESETHFSAARKAFRQHWISDINKF